MFRITEGPSSGSLVHCLSKNYSNASIVSVDTDVFGVMAAYCNPMCVCVCVCSSLSRKAKQNKTTSPSERPFSHYIHSHHLAVEM